jgi:prepilin-type N-terminal cleavage/methylation domain-containing protein
VKHKRRNEFGFTLIELLVVIVIIGILAAIALPNFIKARNKAREAEVKSNIHAIQIALERYAVDSGGVYPTFMIGAERDFNIINCSITHAGGVASFPVHGQTPFAKVPDLYVPPGNPDNLRIRMDPLIQFGYISEYPVNPFARRDSGMWNASWINNTGMTGVYPYGGLHGDKMFDLGFGWGDTPQTDYVLYVTENIEEEEAKNNDNVFSDPDNDSPGNFYYHPMFNDMIPVYFHYAANYGAIYMTDQFPPGYFAGIGIMSDEAAGYMLYGYGAAGDRDSLVEGGLDFFNRMPRKDDLPPYLDKDGNEVENMINEFLGEGEPLDSGVGAGDQLSGDPLQERVETTGYPSQEFDPWTGAFADGINPANPKEILTFRKSGADGVLDWVIIEVSSGVDVKSDTVKDQLQFAT